MDIKEKHSLLGSSICSSVLIKLKITSHEVITDKSISSQSTKFVRNQKNQSDNDLRFQSERKRIRELKFLEVQE